MVTVGRERIKQTMPQPSQTSAFRIPSPDGAGYTCPTCHRFYPYHSGRPTSGGMYACFVVGFIPNHGYCRDGYSLG